MEIDFGVTKRSKLERNFENGSSMYQSGGVEAEEGGSGANSTEAFYKLPQVHHCEIEAEDDRSWIWGRSFANSKSLKEGPACLV
jgi:hypothetical protein